MRTLLATTAKRLLLRLMLLRSAEAPRELPLSTHCGRSLLMAALGMGNRISFLVTLPAICAVLALSTASCTEPEVNRITDPFEKAAYHCRYVLERELAREDELTPAGVLRQKIAEFGPPQVERAGDKVQFTWTPGSIKRKDSADGHGGKCVMLVSRQYVVEATLDGRSLHAGFSF